MPPLVGLAIAGAASYFGAAAAISEAVLGGLVAIDATAVIGATTLGIASDVIAGGVIGAAAGAAGTAAAGGDPGQGALFGAISGGATAGLTPAVLDVTGFGAETSQAIAQGIGTTGAAVVTGRPIGTALEEGAIAGVGNYIGSQAVDALGGAVTPTGSTGFPSTPSNPTGSIAAAQAQWDAQTAAGGGSPVSETATVTAPPPPALYTTPGVETVEVTGQKQKSSPSIFSQIQSSPTTKAVEKTAVATGVDTGLFDLLFGGGGSNPQAASAPAPVSGAGAGNPGVTGGAAAGGAGNGAGATPSLSPAAQAALSGQAGQTGSTSAYAPGGPIFGDLGSGKTQSPWNSASLRTDTAA